MCGVFAVKKDILKCLLSGCLVMILKCYMPKHMFLDKNVFFWKYWGF